MFQPPSVTLVQSPSVGFLLTLLMILCPPLPTQGKMGFKCREGIPKALCLPENYSKFELPNTIDTNRIQISIDIDEVLKINDKDYSITFSTYFNVEWNEKRLVMSPEFGSSLRPPNSTEPVMVPMSLELVKDLWLPNIFIYNLKTYKV